MKPTNPDSNPSTNPGTGAVGQPSWSPPPDKVRKALTKRSFATLATTSAAGRPHVAGVLYEFFGDTNTMILNTLRTSRKARNIAANPHVAVCVPVRRLPVGPPSSVQFQATAELLANDHPDIVALVNAGSLKSLTSHGELDLVDGCFVRINFGPRVLTYGLGMPLRTLIADPLAAGGRTTMTPTGAT